MESTPDITEALADLKPGTKVCLKLADGGELEGTIGNHDVDAEEVQLDGTDPVEVADLEGFLIIEDFEGPE